MVSIIVPVYKAEKYIRECLDSIKNQIYEDWECILVDDGSPDMSGDICDQYAKLDSRFRVFHKKNEGVSSARNEGLLRANGEYIMFIDSDDYVDCNYLSKYVENSDSDFIVGGFSVFGKTSWSLSVDCNESYVFQDDKIGIIDAQKNDPHINILFHICGKLFRNDLIKKNNIRFDEKMKLAEDVCFNIQYLLSSKSMVIINDCGYHYRTSSSNTKFLMNIDAYKYHLSKFSSLVKEINIRFNISLSNISKYINIALFDAVNEYIGIKPHTKNDFFLLYDNDRAFRINTMYQDNKNRRIVFGIAYKIPKRIGYVFLKMVYKLFR